MSFEPIVPGDLLCSKIHHDFYYLVAEPPDNLKKEGWELILVRLNHPNSVRGESVLVCNTHTESATWKNQQGLRGSNFYKVGHINFNEVFKNVPKAKG